MEISKFLIYVSIYIGFFSAVYYFLGYVYGSRKEKIKLFSDDELLSVSVIIPAYNEEDSIAKTIESILSSDYPRDKFEVIVVDDGSTDNTYKIAKRYSSSICRVYTKKNGGKSSALNFGIRRAKGEIIFTMDADTFVEPNCVKDMVRYFKDPKVMCVCPSMLVYKPKGLLQRIQEVDYFIGLFVRRVLSTINSIYVTPGAFSAYRKSFFEKHGLYLEGDITEDLEMALRIQYKGYKIVNSPNSRIYTIAPDNFRDLTNQRKRWYGGLLRNLIRYRKIMSIKYGDLGVFVLPTLVFSIFLIILIFFVNFVKSIINIRKELLFLRAIDFDFVSAYSFSNFVLRRFLINLFIDELFIFFIFFLLVVSVYFYYAMKRVGFNTRFIVGMPLYLIFFSLLFVFWWVVSIFYYIFRFEIKWR